MKSVQIEISSVEKVNLALLQNEVPIIQAISIVNNLDEDLENVTIYVESDPI